MPPRRRNPGAVAATPVPRPRPEEQQKPSTLRKFLAGAARVGSGVLATPVGMIPSPITTGTAIGIGAGGELLAEFIEGSDPNLSRIALEGGLAAIPLGKIIKGGKAAQSALRSGAMTGTGELGRQYTMGEEFSPGSAALATGLGAATGGILSRFTPSSWSGPAPAAAKPTGPAYGPKTLKEFIQGATPQDAETFATRAGALGLPEQALSARQTVTEGGKALPITMRKLEQAKAQAAKLAEKQQREALAKQEFDLAKEGLEPRVQVQETVVAPTAAGKGRVTTKYAAPAEEEGAEVLGGSRLIPGDMPPAEPTAESALAQFFKTRVGATGKNYRAAKEAEAAGEIPSSSLAREAHLREQAALRPPQQGNALTPTPTATPSFQESAEKTVELGQQLRAAGVPPEDLAESIELIEQMRKGGGGGTTLGSGLGGLQDILGIAARNPEFTARLGLGATGAAIGAATSEENPFLGAFVGGAAGATLPDSIRIIQSIGGDPSTVAGLEQKLKSPTGVVEVARDVARNLPQVQRFNYLMDAWGLPANAIVGPMGSAIMGSLTKALSGDTRGLSALGELANPANFLREAWKARNEAVELIRRGELGRAETEFAEGTGEALKDWQHIVASPGYMMTSGDLGARRILMRHGFSDDEARTMTLTAEPELKAGRGLAEMAKRSPFLQFLFPFRRTPVNIMEQGAHRTLGLGFITQSQRPTADPLLEQFVQQGLGAGVGYGASQLGEEMDPETARVLRRYVTNAAGQYSLPAGIGFAIGQSRQRGLPALSGVTARAVEQALPLPTAEPVMDLMSFLGGGRVPRGWVPGMAYREMYPPEPSAPPDAMQQLNRLRRGPRRRNQ